MTYYINSAVVVLGCSDLRKILGVASMCSS